METNADARVSIGMINAHVMADLSRLLGISENFMVHYRTSLFTNEHGKPNEINLEKISDEKMTKASTYATMLAFNMSMVLFERGLLQEAHYATEKKTVSHTNVIPADTEKDFRGLEARIDAFNSDFIDVEQLLTKNINADATSPTAVKALELYKAVSIHYLRLQIDEHYRQMCNLGKQAMECAVSEKEAAKQTAPYIG